MSRRDPYRKRLQNLLNSEALKTLEKIRSTMETREEIRSPWRSAGLSFMADLAPGGRIDKFWKLRESFDSEEQTLLTLRFEKDMPWEKVAEVMRADGEPVTTDALRERFERLMEKLRSPGPRAGAHRVVGQAPGLHQSLAYRSPQAEAVSSYLSHEWDFGLGAPQDSRQPG